MKKQGKLRTIWGILYPALYYMAAQIIVAVVFEIAAIIVTELHFVLSGINVSAKEIENICSKAVNEYMMWIVVLAAIITLPWMVYVFNKDRSMDMQNPKYIKYERVSVFKYLFIIPLAVTSMYAGSYFSEILRNVMPSWFSVGYNQVESVLFGGGVLSQIISVVILAPVVEEIIFRGIIYNRIRRVSGKAIAWILSALFFGVFHLNFVQGVYAFIIGMLLVFVYDRYKSIAAPILFHMCANGVSVLVSAVSSDLSSEASEFTSYMNIYVLISIMGMCVVASIFTAGFVALICQKVNPQPLGTRAE